MKKVLGFVTAVLFATAMSASAFLADTDVEHDSFAIGIAGQNAESTTSLTGVKSVDDIQGYVAGYAARQSSGGAITSETFIGRAQGGFDIKAIKIRGYVEGKRDLLQEIALNIESGYFLESPDFAWQSIDFSAGAGNFVERRELDDAIGRDAADASVSVNWLAFLTAEIGHFNAIARFKPRLDGSDFAAEVGFGFNKDLSKQISLQFTILNQYDSASVADSNVSNQYLLQFVISPE